MSVSEQAAALLARHFGPGDVTGLVSVPGRVNLIGEHIDYHALPVLPMAIQRRVGIAFRARNDLDVRAISNDAHGQREFHLFAIEPSPPGDWANYLKAGAKAVQGRWALRRGIDVAVSSDLPSAAGLSSSSALLAGFAIALLKANLIQFRIEELLDILPEGEHFVGTRGGGMDHAAVLASRAGCALLIGFAPFALTNIPIPPDWSFLVAHSLTTAEKSGAVLAEYNSRRTAGIQALEKLGLSGYKAGLEAQCNGLISKLTSETERMAFLHVTSEASRVQKAVSALDRRDAVTFGELLNASHASLRDRLKVSNSAIDLLARAALEAGALGARLTGAGFGGCVLVFCRSDDREHVRTELIRRYYAQRCNDYDSQGHVFVAEPSAGALGD